MTDTISSTIVDVDTDSLALRLQSELPDLPTEHNRRWICAVRGTLDVMGGIAEYSGSLTLSALTEDLATVVALQRDDQTIRVVNLGEPGNNHTGNGHTTEISWPLKSFYDEGGEVCDARLIRSRGTEIDCDIKLAAISVAYVLLESKIVSHLGGGFTAVIELGIPGCDDHRRIASVQAAVLDVLLQAANCQMEPCQRAVVCRRALNLVHGFASGISTHAAPLLGKPGRILQIGSQPFEVGDAMPVPESIALIGIDSGTRHGAAKEKYLQARTAALMGRELIRRLVDGSDQANNWSGYLARISTTDYVDHIRDKLPTKLRGAHYLERFGQLNDDLAHVEPDRVYKVRSRCEHHIYEDDRVRQFAERLSRASRTGELEPLLEAGELMYASHWSYGQRCGLGSIETDLLVTLLRNAGAKQGVLGARVSGTGAGGTVVAMIRNTDEARCAVERAVSSYQEQTRQTATMQPTMRSESPDSARRCV